MALNPLAANSMGGMGNMDSPFSQITPMQQLSTMQPMAQANFMGNPNANAGMNRLTMPYQDMLSQDMPNNTYARGGVVGLANGGNPAEQMNAQEVMQGGLSQQVPAEDEPPLMKVADALDMGDDTQLTFINQDEFQALSQMGQPPALAEEVAPDPEMVQQLLQGAEGEDYILAYLTKEQFQFLVENFGQCTINEASGLPQFGFLKSIGKAIKSVVSNPIVQAVAPLALNYFAPGFGSALGSALGLGATGTSALIGGGLGLLGGGGLKGALGGAAMGALGQMGSDYLTQGTNPFAGLMGEAPSATNGLKVGESAIGLNPAPSTAKLGELSIPSMTPKAAPSGIASLMPTSTAGKVGLGLGAATLLGGMGSPKVDNTAPPPPDPNYGYVARPMPRWEWRNGRLVSSAEGPTPTGALYARGGLTYADGGALPLMGMDNSMGGPLGGVNPMMANPAVGQAPQMPMTPPTGALGQMAGGPSMGTPPQMPPQAPPISGQMDPMSPAGRYQSLLAQGMPPGMNDVRMEFSPEEMQERGGRRKKRGKKHMGGPMSDMDRQFLMERLGGGAPMGMAGGGYLQGAGDGVSDDIPATIGHSTPAKLSGGEFVLPARVVSELGNGSSEAGAKRLHAFMDKVMSTRRATKDVGADTKAYKYLPA